jgi:ABC-type sugar transport system permease subunit
LNNPGTALGAVGVATAWKFLGFNYLFALAGLRAIPRDPVEAAQVDGAGPWALLTGVVLPLLAPTLLFLGLTTVLQALPNTFVPIQILTKGGPSDASTNLLYAVYQDAFQFFAIGRASAEAVLLLLLLGGLAVWQFRLLERRLDYDR